ncbi:MULTISPECIES: 23S rRNA (pseudouridine(1915)-N(3))-methyltransferase RlmH [unclassified Neochlamydia]|uniref:23S rRNA (pseudouridine(1915)-N(3))-methyltransferase RlmH n=1 Tax=unclassified Neochlamydia TaxID=2643326 RepID=UPI001BCA5A9A|nr:MULTISPECIES: 23S rRNA (pseudouridine(1915)-N(3))-methyltransferase RlmH [unclassified Neochlamydia]MBS4165928.1 Ribosomal RNA large subunit methyltransferase H [Neochlamydia sp. AcF65]MBS4170571.1 Ribosomal RNA large subunit methyltransferase H [Neochlamydia sp. AcF95]
MLRLKIISIGKTKEEWLNDAIQEYVKRLSSILKFEFVEARNNEHLQELILKEKRVICLDAAGRLFDSEKFASFLQVQFIEGGSRLTLVIGGASGLPKKIKLSYPCLSLSPLTMTHQIIRLVLIEQVYRAFEIAKGTPYHK